MVDNTAGEVGVLDLKKWPDSRWINQAKAEFRLGFCLKLNKRFRPEKLGKTVEDNGSKYPGFMSGARSRGQWVIDS